MVTADQIVAHLVGDYILQSDWMANEKTKQSVAALAHVLCYSSPFLFFRPSLAALAFIVVTHFVIDRWRLARYVVYAKNFIAPRRWLDYGGDMMRPPWPERNHPWLWCRNTGYFIKRPEWMSVWLLIIADNTMHLLCNGIALKWM